MFVTRMEDVTIVVLQGVTENMGERDRQSQIDKNIAGLRSSTKKEKWEEVEVRPGTQSAAVQSIRGRGVPRLRSNGRGDLHVHIEVMTPTKIDAEQRRLLEQLSVIRDEQIVVGERSAGLFAKVRGAFR